MPRKRRETVAPDLTIGERVKHFRDERGLSPGELAESADVSRSYLSELESGRGSAQRPSADTLYRLAKSLGVAMSDLLGRPVLIEATRERPQSLLEFARSRDLPESDIEMLAGIEFRGERPRTAERWSFIYDAIRHSQSMDS